MSQANILIIDDDPIVCDVLSRMVARSGGCCQCVHTLADALGRISQHPFDVVFLDIGMPDGSGLDILPEVRDSHSMPETIIITGMGDPGGAEVALKAGAWDYIQKPLRLENVTLTLERALQYRREKVGKSVPAAFDCAGIIGSSPQMKRCLQLLVNAAGSESSVLITGETGTGKELLAQAIHRNSRRADKQFVVVDCAALPETLVESNLFGYEKGAFTGADRSRDGLIKQADGGTLFLDEVGEMSLAIQGSFLRVLQELRFRPVGCLYEVESNFRLVCATNRDLNKMVHAARYRQDLLYRLQALTIEIPPLRERSEDVRDLVLYHMERLCKRDGMRVKSFSPEFFETLEVYHWPGNVRELVNTLENTITNSGDDPVLFPKHLPDTIRVAVTRARLSKNGCRKSAGPVDCSGKLVPLKAFRENVLADAEKQYLQQLMSRTASRIPEACRISGLSRPRLYALLKKYGLTRRGGFPDVNPAAS
jgi:two-component system, NtrC family, response regulator